MQRVVSIGKMFDSLDYAWCDGKLKWVALMIEGKDIKYKYAK